MRVYVALSIGFLVALVALPAGAQAPTVSVKQVDDTGGVLTVVASIVDDSGRPVPGLETGRFSIAVDGAPATVQDIRYGADPGTVLGVVLALDVSGSMAGDRLARAKAAAASFLDTLHPSDQVALLAFNDNVAFFSDFTSDRQALKARIQALGAGGNTALYDATVAAVRKAASAPVPRRAVVLLTDGENVNPRPVFSRDAAVEAARQAGVPIYTVGLGAEADRPFLDQLAEVSRGQARHAPAPADLDRLYAAIGDALRGQYVIRAQPQPVKAAAEHKLTLVVRLDAGAVSQDVQFPGTRLAVLPDPTPAPTPPPTPAPTPMPTVAPVAVAPAAEARGPAGGATIAGSAFLWLGIGALLAGGAGAALLVRHRRRPHSAAEAEATADAAPPPPRSGPVGVPAGVPLRDAPPAVLQISAGPLAGIRIHLNGAPVTIGASSHCTVVLPANGGEVERQHARVWSRDGRYMLHCLARDHAMALSGRQIQWAVLEPGDEFAIGPHAFRFELSAPTVEST